MADALRGRRMRLSTTPFGVIGAASVLYSVGVLGAVYGFLFLPARGWGLLQVAGVLLLLLAALVTISEMLSRATHTKLQQRLSALPFEVTGYPDALGQREATGARLDLTFRADLPEQSELDRLVGTLGVSWLHGARADGAVTLTVTEAPGEGTNWRLHQRVQRAIDDVCVAAHELAPVLAVSVSASSDRTSASAE